MRKQKICGVYCFTHIPTGRKYIGSSVDCHRRKTSHLREVSRLRKKGQSFHAQAAILGMENFTFKIIEECEFEKRLEREAFYIIAEDSVNNGFNIIKDPTKGWNYVSTKEIREKQSASRRSYIKNNPESSLKYSECLKKSHSTMEFRDSQRKKANAQWSDPEARKAQSIRAKKQFESIESRIANSTRRKAHYEANPQYAVIHSQFMKKYHADNPNTSPNMVAVDQFDLDGNLIARHISGMMASKSTGIKNSTISAAIMKNRKSGGFIWRHAK